MSLRIILSILILKIISKGEIIALVSFTENTKVGQIFQKENKVRFGKCSIEKSGNNVIRVMKNKIIAMAMKFILFYEVVIVGQ